VGAARAARYWVGVASREHALAGAQGGFCQVCHGKQAPLARMSRGDGMVYYSPRERFDADVPCRAFTTLGRVADDAPYRFDMGGGFVPYRRNVESLVARDVPFARVRERLEFVRASRSVGLLFRRGHFEISASDFRLIAREMGLEMPVFGHIEFAAEPLFDRLRAGN
jgi:hypothetical protein